MSGQEEVDELLTQSLLRDALKHLTDNAVPDVNRIAAENLFNLNVTTKDILSKEDIDNYDELCRRYGFPYFDQRFIK